MRRALAPSSGHGWFTPDGRGRFDGRTHQDQSDHHYGKDPAPGSAPAHLFVGGLFENVAKAVGRDANSTRCNEHVPGARMRDPAGIVLGRNAPIYPRPVDRQGRMAGISPVTLHPVRQLPADVDRQSARDESEENNGGRACQSLARTRPKLGSVCIRGRSPTATEKEARDQSHPLHNGSHPSTPTP